VYLPPLQCVLHAPPIPSLLYLKGEGCKDSSILELITMWAASRSGRFTPNEILLYIVNSEAS
jgi:hypothetical protein